MRKFILIASVLFYLTSFGQKKLLKYEIKAQKQANRTFGKIIKSPLETVDGRTVYFENYKGKFSVVDFWFTKCGPCFRQFPYMDNIKQKYNDNKLLTFINICSLSSLDEWKQVLIDKKVTGINLFDDNIVIYNRSLIGAPKPSGVGIVHDQLYMNAYPCYAFIDSSSKVLGVTIVAPCDSLLFAYYIDGLLKSKKIEERLNDFKAEIRSDQLSVEFLQFIKNRFNLSEVDAEKLVAPYR